MKKILFTLLFLQFISGAFAQLPSCNGYRYRTYVFPAYDSSVNVQYGHNYTMNNISKNLIMDIYKPNGDTASKRPLLLFIHGGGFVSGSRLDNSSGCKNFALMGYVTATIDYRLIDVPLVDSFTVTKGMIQAVSDAKAAVRFFVQDAATANLYKVDTNNIFIAGTSAGGITASQLAYLDPGDNIPTYISNLISANGGFKGNSSTNTQYGTPVKGILNYSGALWRKTFISTGEPALFSAHDSGDTIVPCNHGLCKAFPFPIYLDGSNTMRQEANLKGIYNDIFINPGSGHGAYFYTSPAFDSVLQKSVRFLYNLICNNAQNVAEITENKILVYPNPFTNNALIKFEIPLRNAELSIYNITGEKIRIEKNISGQEYTLERDHLQSGIYFIQVVEGYKTIEIKKLVIMDH
jgi:para-nitrobenzyl esterase